MALIVEDGTGKSGANAYIDTAFVDSYFVGERLTAWQELDVSIREAAVINATRYIDTAFAWKGRRKTLEQGLNWPRTGVTLDGFPIEGVPARVKQATAEAVGLSMSGEEYYSTESDIGIASEQVDVIKVSYREPSAKELNKPTKFEVLNALLRGLYKETGSTGSGVTSAKVVRA